MVLLWKLYCLGVSPGEVGFGEGLAEQQVELGGVLQAGLPLVEAVSHEKIWRLSDVVGIPLPAYSHTHTRTHTRTQVVSVCLFSFFAKHHMCYLPVVPPVRRFSSPWTMTISRALRSVGSGLALLSQ